MGSTLIYEPKKEICYLMLNRPEVFNALNLQMVRDLISALRRAEEEPDIRVIILKGAGKAWGAGGDLEELLELTKRTASDWRAYLLEFKGMIDTIRGISKPVIAAVNGACVGVVEIN